MATRGASRGSKRTKPFEAAEITDAYPLDADERRIIDEVIGEGKRERPRRRLFPPRRKRPARPRVAA